MILFTPNTVIKSLDINANFADSIDATKQNNPYKFKVTSTNAQTITTSYVKLTWTSEIFDTNNNFDLANNQYTVPVTGYYLFEGLRGYIKGGTAGRDAITLYKDGVNYRWGEMGYHSTGVNYRSSICLFDYFTAGTVISLYMYSDGSNSTTLTTGVAEARFSGILLGVDL